MKHSIATAATVRRVAGQNMMTLKDLPDPAPAPAETGATAASASRPSATPTRI